MATDKLAYSTELSLDELSTLNSQLKELSHHLITTRESPYVLGGTTRQEDTGNSPVQALLYRSHFPGVYADATESDGWLLSTEGSDLILWQMNRDMEGEKQRKELQDQALGLSSKKKKKKHKTPRLKAGLHAAFTRRHTQGTDYTLGEMDAQVPTQTLVAGARHKRSEVPCISLFSLQEDSFLSPQGTIRCSVPVMQVKSLHHLRGHFTNYFATAAGSAISLFDTETCLQSQEPLHSFMAHDNTVSFLQPSPFHVACWTGSSRGVAALWALDAPPSAPSLTLTHHTRAITSLTLVDDYHLYSSCADGVLAYWDTRQPSSPLSHRSIDNDPILVTALAPTHDFLAVSTAKGLYLLSTQTAQIYPLSSIASHHVYTSMTWNGITEDLIAARSTGQVHVYRPRI